MRRYSTRNTNKLRTKNGVARKPCDPVYYDFYRGCFYTIPYFNARYREFSTTTGLSAWRGYIKTFSSPTTYKALLNTLKLVLGVLAGTWLIGGTLAFIRQKTDYKRKKLLDACVFLCLYDPGIYIVHIMDRSG